MKKSLLVVFLFAFSAYLFAQNDGAINDKMLKEIRFKAADYPAVKAIQNAVSGNDINKLSLNRENLGKYDYHFSHQVKTKGISNQERSGRCWLFTGLNILRAQMIKNYNLPSFEFSYNYSFFYDQLEKSNMFLEGIIASADKDIDDKKVEWLIKNPLNDGGQWTMFANIIEKYGLLPSDVMPESHNSNNTRLMNTLLSTKLRENALSLRRLYAEKKSLAEMRETKKDMLVEIYHILELCLGTPPESFTWRYKDEKGLLTEEKEYTPLSFYREFVHINMDDYIMFMNDPTRPYHALYEVEFDRSVVEGKNWRYINLAVADLMEFAKLSLMNNEAMYFSCDVGKQLNSDNGLLDVHNYDYAALFAVDFAMDKKDRVISFTSGSSHAMALAGVDIDKEGRPVKWLLENSWGSKSGHNGYLIMTNAWFHEYMFRLVINKKYISKEVLKILKSKPVLLPPWDPMFYPDL
jgi:bleomycin hydrolase